MPEPVIYVAALCLILGVMIAFLLGVVAGRLL
jgi:hypothetical protein